MNGNRQSIIEAGTEPVLQKLGKRWSNDEE